MKRFLKKNGIKLLAFLLAVALLAGAGLWLARGGTDTIVSGLAAARAPLVSAAEWLSGWLNGVYVYLYDYDRLQAENDALRTQIANAREEARAGMDAVEENGRLSRLRILAEANPDYVFEAARVVSWGSESWSDSFTIAKGSEHGLSVGNCVITEDGYLVGQVAELGENWATVTTLVDVNTSIGALVGEDGAEAMLLGDYSLMPLGYARLAYPTEGAQLFLEEDVYTSGSGGLIPEGIVIGSISSIHSEAGGQTEYGIVTPAVDLDGLVQVFIIKDFEDDN